MKDLQLLKMKVNVVDESKPPCQVKCEHGTGACLTEDDIDFWYQAIHPDDIESVENYLKSVGETRKAELLNGHICAGKVEAELDSVRGLNLKIAKEMTYTRLMNIAAVFGGKRLIEMCLRNRVDVFELDRNGDNVIHVLIRANRQLPQFEEKYISIMSMLKKQLTTDQLQRLLQHENDGEYRPLELAAHLGSFALFKEIFQTKDIYLRGNKNIGMFVLHYYDVTEYESYAKKDKTRRMKSPMWYLCYLENSQLAVDATKEFFKEGPVKVWCEMKIRSNWLLIFLWFMMRLSMVMLSQYWDLSGGGLTKQNRADIHKVLNGSLSINETSCLVGTYVILQSFIAPPMISTTLQYVLVSLACCVLIFDLTEFFIWVKSGWVKRFYRAPGGTLKSVISNVIEFRIIAVLCALSSIVMFISIMVGAKTMLNLAYLIFQSLLVWSLLYFAQILPWIGPTVIQIQRLVQELLSYSVILGLLIVPMSYIIASLLTRNHIGPCPEDFDFTDFPKTVYQGFIILLNMVNLTGYPLEEYISIYTYHLIFVFLLSILILNFVIASFSTTISTLEENREAVVMIQRLAVAMQIEYRVGAVFPSLVHWLHKRTFQYCPHAKAFYINELNPRCGPSTM